MKEAFIIGKDVSKGARSPILWNACFEHFKIDARMDAVDISDDQELTIFFFNILNTDTLAALETINLSFPNLDFQDIAILGSGAVAKSLAFNLRDHVASKTMYARSNHSFATVQGFNFSCKDFSEINSNLDSHQVIVNCTDIGRDGKSDQSPIESSNLSKAHAEHLFIFDINYIDSPSALLRGCQLNGIPSVDGSRMNLMQAAIAFGKSNNLSSIQDEILGIMQDAIS